MNIPAGEKEQRLKHGGRKEKKIVKQAVWRVCLTLLKQAQDCYSLEDAACNSELTPCDNPLLQWLLQKGQRFL